MRTLKNKIAVVTGVASGIGKSLAEKLAKDGNTVFGTFNATESTSSSIRYQAYDVLNENSELEFGILRIQHSVRQSRFVILHSIGYSVFRFSIPYSESPAARPTRVLETAGPT